MAEDLKLIVPEFRDYNSQYKYLFLKKDGEILNLDNFRYNPNIPRIIATSIEGKYTGKKAFLINKNNYYDIYYKDQKFMRIEPNKFSFGDLKIDREHYLYLTFKKQQLDKIPD